MPLAAINKTSPRPFPRGLAQVLKTHHTPARARSLPMALAWRSDFALHLFTITLRHPTWRSAGFTLEALSARLTEFQRPGFYCSLKKKEKKRGGTFNSGIGKACLSAVLIPARRTVCGPLGQTKERRTAGNRADRRNEAVTL